MKKLEIGMPVAMGHDSNTRIGTVVGIEFGGRVAEVASDYDENETDFIRIDHLVPYDPPRAIVEGSEVRLSQGQLRIGTVTGISDMDWGDGSLIRVDLDGGGEQTFDRYDLAVYVEADCKVPRKLIGLSFGRCVGDIVRGTVDINDVLVVIALTHMTHRTDIVPVIEAYRERPGYLIGLDGEECLRAGQELWDRGLVHQPRTFGAYPTKLPKDTWISVPVDERDLSWGA